MPGLFDRITDRVKRELGGGDPDQPGQMSQSLWERILQRSKDLIQRQVAPAAPKEVKQTPPVDERLDIPTLRARIAQAGKLGVLALMSHLGVQRHVEVYSLRTKQVKSKKKGGATIPKTFLYAYCRLHDRIEMFNLNNIEGFQLTDEKYSPRYPVEF